MSDPVEAACSICGPLGYEHGRHEDDSYGACVVCREYIPHTDDETRLVPFPCAVALLEQAAIRSESAGTLDVERLADAYNAYSWPRLPKGTDRPHDLAEFVVARLSSSDTER